jgi:SHAQKYF class myb-like DNA-binding protein
LCSSISFYFSYSLVSLQQEGDYGDCDEDDEEKDDGDDGFTLPDGMKESTGRWTRDEHHTFVKGLEMYGKGWKKIASLIKTRTVVQIRTHAQKYFLKLTKARQNGDTGITVDGKPTGVVGRKVRINIDRIG